MQRVLLLTVLLLLGLSVHAQKKLRVRLDEGDSLKMAATISTRAITGTGNRYVVINTIDLYTSVNAEKPDSISSKQIILRSRVDSMKLTVNSNGYKYTFSSTDPHDDLYGHDSMLYYFNIDELLLLDAYAVKIGGAIDDSEYLEAEHRDTLTESEKRAKASFEETEYPQPMFFIAYPKSRLKEGKVIHLENHSMVYNSTEYIVNGTLIIDSLTKDIVSYSINGVAEMIVDEGDTKFINVTGPVKVNYLFDRKKGWPKEISVKIDVKGKAEIQTQSSDIQFIIEGKTRYF